MSKEWIQGNRQKLTTPPLVLIYAWNELGEGGNILPTEGDGYGYLEAIKEVFGKKEPKKRVSQK